MNRTRRKTRPRPKPQSPRAAPVDPARLAQLKAELRELRKQLLLERDDFQANEQAMAETQQELELSRERYANLYDSAPVGYVLLDREGFIREANLTAARMLGVDRQILCEMMLARFIVESDSRRKLLKHLANCRRSASPVQGTTELKLTAADGRQLDVALTSSPEPSLGKPPGKVRLHSVLEDITARKRAEEALRRSEKLYRAIGESIDYGVWVCAADGRNTYASESFLKLVGQTQEQCSNYGWGDVLHPDDAERTIAAWKKCVRTGGTWDIEHRYRGTDGRYHPVLARGVPIRNEQGEITAWAGINLDISRLKHAEAALRQARDELEERVRERTAELQQSNENLREEIDVRRQAERELAEAELRYRTVADFTYDWEYWETPDLRVNYCSPSCERVTGFSAQEFVGDPSLLQRIVHPEDAALWQKHREDSLVATEPRVIQFRVIKKDGGVRWVEHAWQPVQGGDGRFLGIRACNRDITERKADEIQTQQLREELAHVSRTTTAGHLAASLAHELNQPLTAILSNAQTARILLAADPPDIKEIRDVLDDIEYDSQRAGGVIQRLRALFKKTGQQRGLLQINDVIRETLDLLRSEFVVNGVSAGVHLEPELPHVLGDRIELQQVVLNLIVNAMDAMSESTPGQRRLHISTCGEQDGTIRISIRDSGPGIQVQPVSQLFEPFFTTKASGMGMGLTISQSILEAHGSSLHAANNADRGATFHFNLPVHRIENA